MARFFESLNLLMYIIYDVKKIIYYFNCHGGKKTVIAPFIDGSNISHCISANACVCNKQVNLWYCGCTGDNPLGKAGKLSPSKGAKTHNN